MLNGFGILGSYGVPPAEFQYKTEIPAWREALGAMKVGFPRSLIVPPHLGYGNKEYMNIPPNSWLIYEIELMGIKTTPPQAGGKG
ncbi:MAG: FKBP-type peptidyl-prolyl cis-trans isomerase [bacterium]|nr:FKBP-type peptidyl-prolyl cis-trans isomerase [bacterium]